MRTIKFQSEQDAQKVAEQLYHCKLQGERVIFDLDRFDKRAINLAIALAGVTVDSKILLSFPKHERECTDEDAPRIWIGCLSAYNNGHLHGLWLDAARGPEEILEDILWMLSYSPVADIECCEEWLVFDSGGFDGFKINEYEPISKISKIANAIADDDIGIFGEFYAWNCYEDIDEALAEYQERYQGCYDNKEDFAEALWEEYGYMDALKKTGIPLIECYIDFSIVINDFECGGDFRFIYVNGKYYVFSNY